MSRARATAIAVVAVVAAACAGDDDDRGAATVSSDFTDGADEWIADLSDYTAATRPDDFVAETGVDPPGDVGGDGYFHLGATNTSDDAFMYLRRQVDRDEIDPGQAYTVDYDIAVASGAPSGCAGIGGAPGESVWLEVGAVDVEPVTTTVDGGERTELVVDKGGQSQAGPDAVVAGVIANGIPCEEALADDEPDFRIVEFAGSLDQPVTADADGSLWLFVGTDSGFEGRTDLYYDRLEFELRPQSQIGRASCRERVCHRV